MAECSTCGGLGYIEREYVLRSGETGWSLGVCRCRAGRLAYARWRLHADRERERRRDTDRITGRRPDAG